MKPTMTAMICRPLGISARITPDMTARITGYADAIEMASTSGILVIAK